MIEWQKERDVLIIKIHPLWKVDKVTYIEKLKEFDNKFMEKNFELSKRWNEICQEISRSYSE